MKGITDVPGILVGQQSDLEGLTGCTVVLCKDGAVVGVDVRGSAPGTRETDLMRPCNMVERAHGILLAGGSAFGLNASTGVVKYLEEQHVGLDVGCAKVPLVGGAVLFDLAAGNPDARPDAHMGYMACVEASSGEVEEGNVGAGTGATVAKALGAQFSVKGGTGTYSMKVGCLPDGRELVVGAIVAVNALGDIVDGNEMVACGFDRVNHVRLSAMDTMLKGISSAVNAGIGTNTTIAVVATNVKLDKEGANKVAQMAHDGMARVTMPSHTMYDGDTIFALSTCEGELTGDKTLDVTLVGSAAAKCLSEAILRAVRKASGVDGIPSVSDIG